MANSAMATDRYVPQEHATIQAAVDVCVDGDVVIVAPDPDTAYSGPGNRNIDLKGKIITVRSTDPTDPAGAGLQPADSFSALEKLATAK
ncbi:MAG: hypothetical protein ACYTBZ_31200 [Planctomycetota bacterium]